MSGIGKGLSSLGSSVKDKSTSFGHTVKDKSTSLGHSVKDKTSSFGLSVKDHAYRRHNYMADDDLFDRVYHDLKQVQKALKYLSAQMDRFSKRYWPYVFKSMNRSAVGFLALIGENSLEFKDIDQYYDAFDKLQESLELFAMHPKERQLTISTISFAITNFLLSLEQLRERVAEDSDDLAKLVILKNDEMRQQVKFSMKSLKLRTKRKVQYLDLHRKTEKLMKKNTPLDEKEERELKSLEGKTQAAKGVFENINTRLKLTLPEILSLLEEYIDLITMVLINSHTETFRRIEDEVQDFVEFHGYHNTIAKDDSKVSEAYQLIIDTWESAVTPSRLRIESFLTSISDKHPEKAEEDIGDQDKSSKFYKAWLLAAHKVTDKLHKLKPKDHVNGIFSLDVTADPLQSYLKYESSELNQSENYHPHKTLEVTEVHVPERNQGVPPPLPPRDDFHPIALSPVVGAISSPKPSAWSDGNESNDHLDSDSELSLLSDKSDDEDSLLSTDMLAADITPDKSVQTLKAIYNGSKNDIRKAPIDCLKWANFSRDQSIFDDTNTISYKLVELGKFFESAITDSEPRIGSRSGQEWTAKHDFEGLEPGDLSCKEGDIIRVICDLQDYALSNHELDDNWIVGATKAPEHRRIGFVPANILSKN